jgi:hypothetical protein
MITIIQARSGASRWCEVAYSSPEVAQTFMQVFPAARFLCLYRSLPGVLSETVRAYPWGLGGTPLWTYSAGHPGNNAATIAAYWTARTQALLEFESGYPGSCVRLRYEDLAGDLGQLAAIIFAALGLDDSRVAVLREPPGTEQPGIRDTVARAGASMLPNDRIPPGLLAYAGELHARLGYQIPWERASGSRSTDVSA